MPASGALPTTLVLGKPENGEYMSHVGTHGYSDNLYIQQISLLQTAVQLLPALGGVGRGRLDAMFIKEVPAGGLQIG